MCRMGLCVKRLRFDPTADNQPVIGNSSMAYCCGIEKAPEYLAPAARRLFEIDARNAHFVVFDLEIGCYTPAIVKYPPSRVHSGKNAEIRSLAHWTGSTGSFEQVRPV